jgi:hypothetical protein
MKTLIKIIVILMLLFNGIGAFYGGLSLITDPTGNKLQLPLAYLEHTPFRNYLIPGIILLCVNGFFSFFTLSTIILKNKKAVMYIIAQGILLSGWIIVQIILLQMFYAPLHGTLLVIGILLTVCGFTLKSLILTESMKRPDFRG